MNSSGMKRGLAIAAVTALSLTGLAVTATPASAEPGNVQAGPGVNDIDLIIPGETFAGSNRISTLDDGQNETYRLTAIANSGIASVRFEATTVDGTFALGTVGRNDNGFFGFEWNGVAGGASLADGTALTIRAVGLSSGGAELNNDTYATFIDNDNAVSSASTNVTDGTTLGYFNQTYVTEGNTDKITRVVGTSSREGGTPAYGYYWDSSAQDFILSDSTTTDQAASGQGSTFSIPMDISGYDFAGSDEILIGAENDLAGPDGTADAEGFSLYAQTPTLITAAPVTQSANVPAPGNAPVVVTVTDQNQQPIAGAQVRASSGGAFQYTDGDGQATFTQNPGPATYYVNADDQDAYDAAQGDKISNVATVNPIVAVATSLVATSRDGAAFDFDEANTIVSGVQDITVQVKDQGTPGGSPANFDTTGQELRYRWTITAFGSGVVTTVDGTVAVETNGRFNVPIPTAVSGTYVLSASLGPVGVPATTTIPSSTLLTVKNGDSRIVADLSNPDQAVIGSTRTVTGSLQLADGTGLPGRVIRASVAGAGNARIVRPNGTTGTFRDVTTGANGGYAFAVQDPAAPNTSEDALVSLTTRPATVDQDNPAENLGPLNLQFIPQVNAPVVSIAPVTGAITPGSTRTFRVSLVDDFGANDPVENQVVNLTVSNGFFTDGNPDPLPATGNDTGEFRSLGNTIQVTTNALGQADFQVAIERDAGFDDDGRVNAVIGASARGGVGNFVQPWDSSNPLNGGAVAIDRAAAAKQTVGILPKAPTNESVLYDVVATDQFGNRTDVPVAVGVTLGTVNGNANAVVTSQFTNDNPSVVLRSTAAGAATPQATWTANTVKYTGGNPPLPLAGQEILQDNGEVVNWYVINFAASKYSLTRDTGATLPVGASVIYTYTATDQEGEPINDVTVNFFRTGPDVLQDGNAQTNSIDVFTNQQGRAQYVYTGSAAGNADTVALVRDTIGFAGPPADGQPTRAISESRATDRVTFLGGQPGDPVTNPVKISVKLTGSSKGSKDNIKVKTSKAAAGATVKIFRITANGKKLVGTKVLKANGKIGFTISDLNGAGKTKYQVKVAKTADTRKAKGSLSVI